MGLLPLHDYQPRLKDLPAFEVKSLGHVKMHRSLEEFTADDTFRLNEIVSKDRERYREKYMRQHHADLLNKKGKK